ncbi:hypothetical protein [Bacteroides helcogenes]|nr:hypothetical protein [Bacteroides helcogenes]MDY5237246.1 hypothetical protein [Bacteroides helcogenes]
MQHRYGYLLGPYVHDSKYAESLTDAKNRIMREKGMIGTVH